MKTATFDYQVNDAARMYEDRRGIAAPAAESAAPAATSNWTERRLSDSRATSDE